MGITPSATMWRLLLGIFLLYSLKGNVKAARNPRCVIVSPNLVTVGVPFSAYIIVYDADDVEVTLNIQDGQTGGHLVGKTVTTTRGSVSEVKLVLAEPPQPYDIGQYYVTLQANTSHEDILLPQEKHILVTFHQGHVFIQLKKARVHPGKMVTGRLFSVDDNLRILKRHLRVELLDPAGRAVTRYKAQLLPEGKKAYFFQLLVPEDAELGIWKVKVRHGHQFLASDEASLEVTNSGLPPLYIRITADKFILPTTKHINITVSASYPSDDPDIVLTGTAKVEVQAVTADGKSLSLGGPIPAAQIFGTEASFSLPLDELNFRFDDLVGSHLLVKASIHDKTTGMMETKSNVTSVFVTSPYVIDVTKTATTFKPNMTYTMRAVVKDVLGNPLPDMNVEVTEGNNMTESKTDASGSFTDWVTVGDRISALRFVLRTRSEQPDDQEAEATLLVTREVSASRAYIKISRPDRPALIGQRYAATVTFNPSKRIPGGDYGVMHYVVTSKDKVQDIGTMSFMDSIERTLPTVIDYTMAPAFNVLFFYVRRDGDIVSDSIWVEVQSGTCQNDIKLESPTELRPSEKLHITVTGDPGTFVSTQIMEDRLLMGSHYEQLTKPKLAELQMKGQCKQDGGKSPSDIFFRAGLTLLSNTNINVPTRTTSACMLNTKRRHRRSVSDEFKEKYVNFEGFLELGSTTLGSEGSKMMERRFSSLVGHWHLQAMGISETSGFCVSNTHALHIREKARSLQVVIPYQGRVNEVVQIMGLFYWKYQVYNVTAELQVEKGVCSLAPPGTWTEPITLEVQSGKQVTVTWPVIPLTARKHTVRIRVTAIDVNTETPTITTIKQIFYAEKAGVERKAEKTFLLGTPRSSLTPTFESDDFSLISIVSGLIENKETKTQSFTIRAKVPEDALYGTGKVELRVTGEPLGHVVLDLPAKGLSGMMGGRPIGCGEQSMMRIGPFVYALQYLKQTGQLEGELFNFDETTLPRNVSQGIFYMNRFRNETGAYSTWPGKEPSTWLTAYVVKVFSQASVVTDANGTLSNLVCEGAKYVAGRQGNNGQFDDPIGIIMEHSIAGGLEGTTAMTAYVTVALLEVMKYIPECQQTFNLNATLTKAIEYLIGQTNTTKDLYTLSMIAYSLQLAHHSARHDLLDKLLQQSEDNEARHWRHWHISKKSLTEAQRINLIRNPVLTMEIETAAYTLLALVEADKMEDASEVASWLTSQHRSNGHFISTQDTVVALQALTHYRSQVPRLDLKQKVSIEEIGWDGTNKVYNKNLTNDIRNLRYTFTYDLPEPDSHKNILIQLEGEGEVRLEVVSVYNTLEGANTCVFNLDIQVSPRHLVPASSSCYSHMNDDSSCMEICYRYPDGNGTNMAILHVGLHQLHRPNMQSLQDIADSDDLVDYVDTTDQAVVFYLKEIHREEHCISFVVDPKMPLPVNTMPLPVHLYDYHDSDRLQCEKFYQPNTKTMQAKPPVETYLTADKEYVCAEVPQPVVHDFLNQRAPTPKDKESMEYTMCDRDAPANVYAMRVQFTSNTIRNELFGGQGNVHHFLEGFVEKIVKKGPIDNALEVGDQLMFYVKPSWLELLDWTKKTQGEPHLIISSSPRILKKPADGNIKLHMDQGDMYIQRIVPNINTNKTTSTNPETRRAWRKLKKNEGRVQAKKNKAFTEDIIICKT